MYTKEDRMKSAEIRKEKDKYAVWIPDPGWVDCGPDCKSCKSRDKEKQLIRTHSEAFTTVKEAIEYTFWLGFKDVKLAWKKDSTEEST